MDTIHFPCDSSKSNHHSTQCIVPHFYHIIYPEGKEIVQHKVNYGILEQKEKKARIIHVPNNYLLINNQFFENGQVERPINLGEWTINERETFKRFFLLFGFGRWSMIREATKNSGYSLEDKNDEELIRYANSFMSTLASQLNGLENKELRQFLQNLVDTNLTDYYIDANVSMWGNDILTQRVNQWSKRVHLLYIVNRIVNEYKLKKKQYLTLDPQKQDQKTKRQYLRKENLLNFIANDQLIGMRPANWWLRKHDIDLIFGTYKWGYGNYQVMREDPKLIFNKIPKNDPYYIFPLAENITRRLKKLAQLISRIDGNYDFEGQTKPSEPTGFSVEEKNAIVTVIGDFGLPFLPEDINKIDWANLKYKVFNITQKPMLQSDQKLEKFVNYLQIESEKLIQEYNSIINTMKNDQKYQHLDFTEDLLHEFRVLKAKDLKLDYIDAELNFKTDDEDDFIVNLEQSFMIQKRILLFNIIRKFILIKEAALFEQHVEYLQDILQEQSQYKHFKLPQDWSVGLQDRGLLKAVTEQGVGFLKDIKFSYDYGLNACRVSAKRLLRRVEWLVSYFKNLPLKKEKLNGTSGVSSAGNTPLKASMIQLSQRPNQKNRINIEMDDDGNIKYPIVINQSLKILDLGYIEFDRASYHSERNLFPIGYKSLRVHSSCFVVGGKAEYICEILDGGEKPMFKVTCSEFTDKPIIKESTSGCWLEIVRRIEQLTNMRKGKVTVSGPDRFGLQETSVIQLIQQMPNADRCQKYIFR